MRPKELKWSDLSASDAVRLDNIVLTGLMSSPLIFESNGLLDTYNFIITPQDPVTQESAKVKVTYKKYFSSSKLSDIIRKVQTNALVTVTGNYIKTDSNEYLGLIEAKRIG
jgi:hypothetical protein